MPDAELMCDWPLCDRCLRRIRYFRVAILLAMGTGLVGLATTVLMVATRDGMRTEAESYGLIALLLGVAMAIFLGADFSRSAVGPGKLTMTSAFDAVIVSAHPAFAADLARSAHHGPESGEPG